ncbi:MAG TPA: GNAT family N-acetyltransferase [Verrucomicrobiae bacterium]|nr:GNAT family N-acetyltransferase [Verrucomicrobiae bacterium]
MSETGRARTAGVRLARESDAARLAELAGQLTYPSTPGDVAKRLEGMRGSADHAVFVAEDAGGKIVGFAGVYVNRTVEADARVELSGLVVDEAARSQGTGKRLLDCVEEWAREKGCRAVGLRSNVIRERAHEFYERHGYRQIKTQKAFRKEL